MATKSNEPSITKNAKGSGFVELESGKDVRGRDVTDAYNCGALMEASDPVVPAQSSEPALLPCKRPASEFLDDREVASGEEK